MRLALYTAAFVAAFLFTWNANSYYVFIMATLALTAIVGIGLNVLLGLAGQVSFGHVGFYALGAYTVAILTVGAKWSFWAALPVAALVAALTGALLALPAVRVKGPYLAMVTIAFGFIVEHAAVEWRGVTGGQNGIMGIPNPFGERGVALIAIGVAAVVTAAYHFFQKSRFGAAMRAVRDAEVAAESIGLAPVRIKTAAFAISALCAGIAGALFALLSGFVTPSTFAFSQSILFVLVVMIGGAGSVAGPLVGATIVVLLPELLAALAEYRLLFFGALLLFVLWIAPDGVVGSVLRLASRKRKLRPAIGGASPIAPRQRTVLAVHGLGIAFGGVRAAQDIAFEARPGEVTSLIGPNGAGKTTVLNMLSGFYRPEAGSIRIGDLHIQGRPAWRIARAGVARTYQTTQLFGSMSVAENLAIASGSEALAAYVGYTGDLDARAADLPHVDKRLVEIARALALAPGVLLLDEPAAGLDDADTERLGHLLGALTRFGIVVILVEHDMKLVMGVSDHVIVLDAGVKIAEGTPAQVAADPAVLKAYLGEGAGADRMRATPLSGGDELLAARGLSAGYGATNVLRDVAVAVAQGEMVAVLGPNGAGKSTLMRALSGLGRPVGGEVRFLGDAIERLDASAIAARGLVLVPEGRQVFPELNVIDNLLLGAYARPDGAVAQRAEQLLARFPQLQARREQRAGLLSGGEQQMLAIARGLMARPRVLMLDEPSLGLAPKLVEGLYDLLARLRDESVTILLVDQAAVMALSVADRAYVLQSGRIVHAGAANALRDDPGLAKAYLG